MLQGDAYTKGAELARQEQERNRVRLSPEEYQFWAREQPGIVMEIMKEERRDWDREFYHGYLSRWD